MAIGVISQAIIKASLFSTDCCDQVRMSSEVPEIQKFIGNFTKVNEIHEGHNVYDQQNGPHWLFTDYAFLLWTVSTISTISYDYLRIVIF